MLKSILVTLILGLSQFNVNADSTCNSSFTVSKDSGSKSLIVSINSNSRYECQLLVFERGKYVEIESVTGSVSEHRFEGIETGKVYMIKLVFSNEEGLCKTRKLGGIKL